MRLPEEPRGRHHRQSRNNSPQNPAVSSYSPSGTYTLGRHSRRLDRTPTIPSLALRSPGASLFALPVSIRSLVLLAVTLPYNGISTAYAQGLGHRHQHTMASESSSDLHAPTQKPMLSRHREGSDAVQGSLLSTGLQRRLLSMVDESCTSSNRAQSVILCASSTTAANPHPNWECATERQRNETRRV
jgi:hypothetical protein